MVKLIIEIPDDFYKKVQDNYRLGYGDAVQIPIGCIVNGTPLDKIIAVKEKKLIEDKTCNYGDMTLQEFMDERYKNREDKDNMFGVGVSDEEFREIIIDYFLGEDWYVVDPIGQTQVNEIALYKILEKYSKRYRKECKKRKSKK